MKKLNNAFTLTELLVALGVVSILCAILLPVIFNVMPNQNTMMAKRAYYTVQTVVSELINDEGCYPDRTNSAANKRTGFDDGTANANCSAWNNTAAHNFASGEDANTKFITLFLDKLGIKYSELPETADEDGNVRTDKFVRFKTRDGIFWGFWKDEAHTCGKGFNVSEEDGGCYYLAVDVNGQDNKPNCSGTGTGSDNHGYTGELGAGTTNSPACTTSDTRKNGYDRFRMKIHADGEIEITSTDIWAINAVKIDRNITSDKNSNAEDDGITTTEENDGDEGDE